MSRMRKRIASVAVVALAAAMTACGAQDPYVLRAEHHRVAAEKANAIDDYDRAAREAEKADLAYRRAARRLAEKEQPAPSPPAPVPAVL